MKSLFYKLPQFAQDLFQPRHLRINSVNLCFVMVCWICSVSFSQGADTDLSSASAGQPETTPAENPLPNRVGSAGAVDHLDFTGNHTFSAQALRKALNAMPSYQLASEPMANRTAFQELVQQKVLLGYQNCGFANAQVRVHFIEPGDRVHIVISEGQRFRCGQVKVHGISAGLAAKIIKSLSQARAWDIKPKDGNSRAADAEAEVKRANNTFFAKVGASLYDEAESGQHPLSPEREQRPNLVFWVPGKPAHFGEPPRKNLESNARDALAEEGYLFSKVSVQAKLDPVGGTADLIVNVDQLGPPGDLAEVNFRGNLKNTGAEIETFTGLTPGMAITRGRLQEAEKKLNESGRFLKTQLIPEPFGSNATTSHIRLTVKVVELTNAPPLGQSLSREQAAMLQLGRWLSDYPQHAGGDLRLTIQGRGACSNCLLTCAVSPRLGLIARLIRGGDRVHALDYALVLKPHNLGVFAAHQDIKWQRFLAEVRTKAYFHLKPNMTGVGDKFTLSTGAGWVGNLSGDRTQSPPLELDLQLAPAALMDFATTQKNDFHFQGHECLFSNSNYYARFDSRSGKLAELRFEAPDFDASLTVAPDAFQQAVNRLEKTISWTNRYEAAHPVSSLVSFIAGEIARSGLLVGANTNLTAGEFQAAISGLQKLAAPVVFSPLDGRLGGQTNSAPEDFKIPPVGIDTNQLLKGCAWVSRQCQNWFPKNSWPWTMTRNSLAVCAGDYENLPDEVNRLVSSPDTGPIGLLALGEALRFVEPQVARKVAIAGLIRMRPEDFQQDCRLLWAGDSQVAQMVGNVADALRTMSPEEVNAVAKLLPSAEARLLRECAAAFRQAPKEPLARALAIPLNHYWEQRLRDRVHRQLRKLAVFYPTGQR